MREKKKLTRLCSFLLALVMVVGMMPTIALAAESATADFSTDPTTALGLLNAAKTGAADSTWDGSTLTLNGVNFETTAATAVELPDSAIIVLNGVNTIKGGNSESAHCYGIRAYGNLTIKGSGTLIVTGGDTTLDEGKSCGIFASDDLNIEGGTVTATGGAADYSYGTRADNDINITGGNVTGTGSAANDGSYGLYVYNDDINISGGTVTATGGTVTGGTATDGYSYGIRAFNGDINISGGTVIATGGAADYSYGTRADNDINITGGNVTGTGGAADVKSYGIRAADYINISDGNVTGIGGTANDGSYGLYVYNDDINISGGTVTATGGAAVSSYGIYADCDINISGGNLIAKAELSALNNAHELPSAYQWRTSDSGDYNVFPDSEYSWSSSHTYLEIREPNSSIITVAITGVDAPKSNKALDTEADCNTTGVSNAKPTVTWDSSDSKAGYGKIYTASITLTASEGYVFADSTTVTVNGNPATSVTKNANGTLTVTYTFPATDKHNIEITVDTDVRDGDAAKNPTISSGYEIEYCFFVEDTDKDGVFINKTGNSITLDDKTLVVDKTLVEAFAAQSGGRFTYESLMAELKDEFDLDELKTEFTGGYDYSVLAYICHSDNAYFDYDDNQIVTNAIVKVNGKKITDNCLGYGGGMEIMPVAYVFSAAKTYTVSFDANGGTGTMAAVTDVSGEYTLPANGFTAPTGKQFKCWSVDGNKKKVGDTITITADTTVTAVWKTKTGNKPSGNIQSPQTGDNSMMWLWGSLLFVSSLGVAATAVYGKKRTSVK